MSNQLECVQRCLNHTNTFICESIRHCIDLFGNIERVQTCLVQTLVWAAIESDAKVHQSELRFVVRVPRVRSLIQ